MSLRRCPTTAAATMQRIQRLHRHFSSSMAAPRPPLPPFTQATAAQKVRAAEDAWNTRDAKRVAQAYTVDSQWRNRSEFLTGRDEIEAFLTRKWAKESQYRLIKELFAFNDNRIAVRFAYEWQDAATKQWYRAYGNENWIFDDQGYMAKRYASINDVPIKESERKYHWKQGERRPDDHPSLSDLGLFNTELTPLIESKCCPESSPSMAAIYRGSPSRFPFGSSPVGPTHYTTSAGDHSAGISLTAPLPGQSASSMPMRYNAYAVEGHSVPLPSISPTSRTHSMSVHQHTSMAALNLAMSAALPPPGATLGLLHTTTTTSATRHSYAAGTLNSGALRPSPVPLYLGNQLSNGASSPMFVNPAYSSKAFLNNGLERPHSPEMLMVSPGVPTPVELSIYENKQPTGLLHVTIGNQTVEFLDGVANMPQRKRTA
ncbi:TPA: hypothetical protein N0F65_004839 [Lagenidium giganteum]|uniref:Uncharacterized protein n=1 Tax=Lagenidium giganteum TaxID=4803 RepID=A0AAV2ZA08_9STRA|nr:TPA: hypothetical protein N0F65_004839 [Lagenidium giganteum]